MTTSRSDSGVLLGAIVAYVQERQAPETFQTRVVRLRAAPVIALLVALMMAAGWAGKETDTHPVTDAGPLPARPTMRQAFDDGRAQGGPCTVPLDDDRDLWRRSMLRVGAEEGGLSATYRTAAAPPLALPETGAARRPQPVPPWGGRRREQCGKNYDLFVAFGRDGDRAGDPCLGDIPAITAGSIPARFAYVTASAVVGGCGVRGPAQLVDVGISTTPATIT